MSDSPLRTKETAESTSAFTRIIESLIREHESIAKDLFRFERLLDEEQLETIKLRDEKNFLLARLNYLENENAQLRDINRMLMGSDPRRKGD